jgi:hypothetical protein
MLTPPTINKSPGGLLGFLGLKNGGRNPSQFGELVAPTWDLSPLYLYTNTEYTETLPSAAAIGYVPAFTVPNGEFWYVHEYGVYSAVLGAGQSVTWALAMRDPGGSIVVNLTPAATVTVVGTRGVLGTLLDRALSPGTTLGLYVTQLAAGPVAFSADLRFSRMVA